MCEIYYIACERINSFSVVSELIVWQFLFPSMYQPMEYPHGNQVLCPWLTDCETTTKLAFLHIVILF